MPNKVLLTGITGQNRSYVDKDGGIVLNDGAEELTMYRIAYKIHRIWELLYSVYPY